MNKPTPSLYENATQKRIERWLSAALKRQKELKAKIVRREDTRAWTILQRRYDELSAQIRGVQHELDMRQEEQDYQQEVYAQIEYENRDIEED